MNESEKKSNGWLPILGGLLLIAVLFAGIKLIFAGLEQVLPKQVPADSGSSVSVSLPDAGTEADAPDFCMFCGKELPETFQWGQFCPYCGKEIA